ncbi:MAG: hypothetical protein GY851_34230 [bacterium]|nr:hypothetical protein [bacterium]
MVIAITALYFALTGLGALVFFGDVREVLPSPPGDSLMFLDAAHCLGYAALLVALLVANWRPHHVRSRVWKADAVIVVSVLAGVMWLAGQVRWAAPSVSPMNPIWLALCCAFPGFLGAVMGRACLPPDEGAPRRILGLLAGALVGATIFVWPIEAAVTFGALANVRGLPPGWTQGTLGLNLGIACCMGAVSLLGIVSWHLLSRGKADGPLLPQSR